jgi:hypothetical protein
MTMVEQIKAMEAPRLIENEEHWERVLGHLLEKAQAKHADLTSVPGNRWQPGDRCEDALLTSDHFQGALMAFEIVVASELELDARMAAAKRINEQDDPACD